MMMMMMGSQDTDGTSHTYLGCVFMSLNLIIFVKLWVEQRKCQGMVCSRLVAPEAHGNIGDVIILSGFQYDLSSFHFWADFITCPLSSVFSSSFP